MLLKRFIVILLSMCMIRVNVVRHASLAIHKSLHYRTIPVRYELHSPHIIDVNSRFNITT